MQNLELLNEKANNLGYGIFKIRKQLTESFKVQSVEECKTALALAHLYLVKGQHDSMAGKAFIEEAIELLLKNPPAYFDEDVTTFWEYVLSGEYVTQKDDLPLYF